MRGRTITNFSYVAFGIIAGLVGSATLVGCGSEDKYFGPDQIVASEHRATTIARRGGVPAGVPGDFVEQLTVTKALRFYRGGSIPVNSVLVFKEPVGVASPTNLLPLLTEIRLPANSELLVNLRGGKAYFSGVVKIDATGLTGDLAREVTLNGTTTAKGAPLFVDRATLESTDKRRGKL